MDTSKNLHRGKTALNDFSGLAQREGGTKGVFGGLQVMLARLIGAGIIAAFAPATIASAQSEVPDLKGVWTGTAEGVMLGTAFEHVTGPAPEAGFQDIQFTITIERQEGDRFAGTWASERATDALIGMIRSDGRRLHMVDNDGTFTGELLGPDEMEVCRTEVAPDAMVVHCGIYTRQQ